MRALRHVVVVKRSQHRPEGIRINDVPFSPGIGGLETQGLAVLELNRAFKESGLMGFCEIADLLAGERMGGERVRPADKGPGHEAPANLVQAQDGEGVMVLANDKSVNFSLA